MIEIFQKLSKHNHQEITETTLLTSPTDYIGGSVTNEHRLLFFDNNQSESIYIDFATYKITIDKLYYIPAKHLLYLPNTIKQFYCILIPTCLINDIEKSILFSLYYKNDKSIKCDLSFTELKSKTESKRFLSELVFHINNKSHPSLQYIKIGEKFLQILYKTKISHKLTLQSLSNELDITDKTLQRVCNTVYSVSPIAIIRYHLLLKAVFIIISKKLTPFYQIADELGFEEVSTFNRYIKTILQYTPTTIRKQYSHIIL
ncbi:helix-turn-helix domain-containing protein [Flavobacterium sp. KACC 22761]|uniref:helix-turn-helix domain-containing protein n=1 Tax=Flavobacterium sp. KACC 22761 TaxID=3092665 RepID=UPI002A765151|nr:helix-turn-helix domain-containing protein [Flavobacterium sp. KACC 22761]WPO78874.1 helix-turn-helix domain-containing protein [Flavobacterium sp. KACC 22761]